MITSCTEAPRITVVVRRQHRPSFRIRRRAAHFLTTDQLQTHEINAPPELQWPAQRFSRGSRRDSVLQRPAAWTSERGGTRVTAFEPGDCARDDTARFGAECAFYDERKGTRTDGEYLIEVLHFSVNK